MASLNSHWYWTRDDSGRMAPSSPPSDTVDIDFLNSRAPTSLLVRALAKADDRGMTVSQLVAQTGLSARDVERGLQLLRANQFVWLEGLLSEICAKLTADGRVLAEAE